MFYLIKYHSTSQKMSGHKILQEEEWNGKNKREMLNFGREKKLFWTETER